MFWRMDKLDQILEIISGNQKSFADIGSHLLKIDNHLSSIDKRLDGIDIYLNKLDSRTGRLEDNIVGINTRLMVVEDQVGRIAHIEEVVDRTFTKIDDFMTVLNRHESEIAALGMKYTRLEDRVVTLESQSKA